VCASLFWRRQLDAMLIRCAVAFSLCAGVVQYRCLPFVGVLAPHAYGASEPVTQTNNSA
jgi:hypothetical protein